MPSNKEILEANMPVGMADTIQMRSNSNNLELLPGLQRPLSIIPCSIHWFQENNWSNDLGTNWHLHNVFTAVPMLLFYWVTGRSCVYTKGWESWGDILVVCYRFFSQ